MLLNKRITSYAIIIFFAAVLILSVNAIAQTKGNKFTNKNQVEKKPVPQKKQLKKNSQAAAAPEAAIVFAMTGISCVAELDASSANMPAFAAVSPKRDSGPWKSAGPTPL